MDREEDYTMEWKHHASEAFEVLAKLRGQRAFTDVTLHCGEMCISAHRVVLAACSSYLEKVLNRVVENSPPTTGPTAIVLKDAPSDLLELSVSFMYTGVAHVPSERLDEFFALAESLEIRGLKSQPLAQIWRPSNTSEPPSFAGDPLGAALPVSKFSLASHMGHTSPLKRMAPPASSPDAGGVVDAPRRTTRPEVGSTPKFQYVDRIEAREIPTIKSEVYVEDDSVVEEWTEMDDTEEVEFNMNELFPMEYAVNIPEGIAVEVFGFACFEDENEEDYTFEWKNHACEAFGVLAKLRGQDAFTHVTLHSETECIRAHRLVLAACSPHLEEVLNRVVENSPPPTTGHTAVVLKDAPADLLEIAVNFMYTGAAQVPYGKHEYRCGPKLPGPAKVFQEDQPLFVII